MLSNDQQYVLKKMEAEYVPLNEEFRTKIEPNFASKDWYTKPSSDSMMGKIPTAENYEFLYLKTFTKLMILAILIRQYGKLCIVDTTKKVKILRDIKETEPHEKLIFTIQEKELLHGGDFSQKVKDEITMRDACNYIIHHKQSSWPRAEKGGKILNLDGDTMIYIGLATEKRPEVYINFSNLLTRIGEIIERIRVL